MADSEVDRDHYDTARLV